MFLFPEIEKEDVNKLCDKFFRFFCELIVEVSVNPKMTVEQFTSTTKSDFLVVSKEFRTKYLSYIAENLHLTR